MVIVVYLTIRLITHLILTHKAHKDHIRWLEERDRVADATTMAKFKWSEEDSPIDDLPHEEAANFIRQNLEAKKSS
jgi:hypothetical protein